FDAKELLFFCPNEVRPKHLSSVHHSTIYFIHYRPTLQPTLYLPLQPRRFHPRFYRVDAAHFVAKPLESTHAHQRGLARPDFADKKDFHRLLRNHVKADATDNLPKYPIIILRLATSFGRQYFLDTRDQTLVELSLRTLSSRFHPSS